jgi:hypothetical protein
MTLGNMRANGVRSLDVPPDRPFVRKRSLAGFGYLHPHNSNPPSPGAHRSRLDCGQLIARELVQQRIRKPMGQHGRRGAAMLRVGE